MATRLNDEKHVLYGAPSSPYTLKMISYLRFKQIPHEFKIMPVTGNFLKHNFPKVPPVIPVLVSPNGEYTNDSTFLIKDLETEFPERSVYPDCEIKKFLNLLIEDFADEWMTKIMYASRWGDQPDHEFSAKMVVGGNHTSGSKININKLTNGFKKVQVNRTKKVGAGNWEWCVKTAEIIFDILSRNLEENGPYLFGNRPSAADFGIYGQMTQFPHDLPIAEVMRKYPYAWAQLMLFADGSGVEITSNDQWFTKITDQVKEILNLIGTTYVPFLKANAEGYVKNRNQEFDVSIFNGEFTHSQKPFSYQYKCWKHLCQEFENLSENGKEKISAIFEECGVENIFTKEMLAAKL